MTKRFTLVEVLTVTGIIAILAALILVVYNGVYRSWSSRNTIATMKAAQLALDKYRLDNGSFPVLSNGELTLEINDNDPEESQLAKNLLQECAPYAKRQDNHVYVFDDFGKQKPIRYIFPYKDKQNNDTQSFALISAGKDGEFGEDTEDDIIFLPAGDASRNLKPGFYMTQVDENGTIHSDADIEPLGD